MDILIKLAVAAGWFSLVVIVAIALWSAVIWLINRKVIGSIGASIILLIALFIAIWLCTLYK